MDTGLGNHPKMAALPNDTARYGWMLTLLEAKEQKAPGQFASANHFRHVLGKYGKYLQDYLKAGLFDEVDGRLEVHGWSEYQRDRTAAERQRRHRDTSVTVTDGNRDITVTRARGRAVALAVDVVVPTEGVQGEPDAAVSLQHRTGDIPGPKILGWLNQLSKKHGERALARKIDGTPFTGDVVEYLKIIRAELVKDELRAEAQEARDEGRRLEEKRRSLPAPVASTDISEEEARRLALEYTQRAKSA